jgi:hypothetical protein
MDPISALLLASLVAYVVVAPDPVTRVSSRGTAGAARAAAGAARTQLRAEWIASAPARRVRRDARHKRWATTRGGRALLFAERGLLVAGHVARFSWRAARVGGRVARAAAAAVPDGWRAGTAAARATRTGWTAWSAWLDRTTQRLRTTRNRAASEDTEHSPDPAADADPGAASADPSHGPDTRRTPDTADGPGAPGAPGDESDPLATVAGSNPEGDTMPTTDTATEARPIRVTDLTTVDDLRVELDDAESVLDVLETYLRLLADWIHGLPDRYAAAPFGTASLARGVAGVTESAPPSHAVQGLHDALSGLRHEIDETTSLTEAAETLDADGEVGAFRTT